MLTYVDMSTIWGWQNGALACARCAFCKMSSRLRAVRIFTVTYQKLMFLVRRPSRACLLRTCHRALACAFVFIFEQCGALASTPCAFRFPTGSGAMIPSISNTVQNLLSRRTTYARAWTCMCEADDVIKFHLFHTAPDGLLPPSEQTVMK